MSTKTRKKRPPHRPSDIFSVCPQCESKELLKLEVDVMCLDCSWNSAKAYVDCGGMDNLFGALADHIGLHRRDWPC